MLQASDDFPMNLGFLGKGNCSNPEALREQVRAGVIGLKLHEDWGTTPSTMILVLGCGRDGHSGCDSYGHFE